MRGGRGFVGRADGREVKSLPERAKVEETSDDGRDWKWMFRISSNWRTGMSSVNVSTFSTLIYLQVDAL